MTALASQNLKAALAIMMVLVIAIRWLWRRQARARGEDPGAALRRIDRISTAIVAALAVVGVGNYFGFSYKPLIKRDQVGSYDLVHYYLNAKYFRELGYTHLYEAVVIADQERKDNFHKWRFMTVRDLDSSQVIPMTRVYARADEIKRLFRPARWREFKNDYRFFQRTLSRRSQRDLLNDHGYNGPPLLQAFAGPVTNLVPVESIKLLCHVETVLILLLFWLLYRTHGAWLTATSVLWYSICFSARWPGISFGIFRIDWFIALVVACCLLKGAEPEDGLPTRQQRWRLLGAGALLGYSAMMKIFPLVWLFGLGVRALWLLTQRRIDRVAATVFAGFLASVAVCAAVAWTSVGRENIEEFVEDITEHLDPMNLSSQRMGFGVALGYRGETREFESGSSRHDKFALVGSLTPYRYAGGILALLLLALTVRPRDPHRGSGTSASEATELGFIPFYLLMIASHYYWINRLTMVLHHGQREHEHGSHAVGLALLFAVEALTNLMDQKTHFRYGVMGMTSVALGLYCLWVIGTRLYRTYRPGLPQPAPQTAAA